MKTIGLIALIIFFTQFVFGQFPQKELLKKLNADKIEMDQGNGDGVFKARSAKTKQWGMFQNRSTPIEMIPMKYDSIEYFKVNEKFTIVYQDEKLGVYLSYFDYEKDAKQSVSCLYDDYKVIIVPYNGENRFPPIRYSEKYIAFKKNGKWGWVDWFTGEEQSEFIYNSTDDLPTPEFMQNWM